ncbi:MAG: cobalamin-independent methionine synthase II family protein [Alphaproteobacteria bacterium]|nr:cobalamin-independent methionine synthase II family protein [Alphaproteobacteria bacterium]
MSPQRPKIRTTAIGAYPKPDYAPVANWFDLREVHRRNPTGTYSAYLRERADDAEALLDRATEEVVREQAEIGIDIPTDGEIRREHYIYYHLRRIDGFDFDHLTTKAMRDGSWKAEVPTVVSPLSAGAPFLARDWRVAQSVTEKPVKITVPGPLTIIDSTANAHYESEQALALALADVLAVEIGALADAGCRWIQVDEPLFARNPEKALAYGVEALDRRFAGVPTSVNKAVHICCGYPSELDLEDYPKTDAASYFDLADALDRSVVDAVSLEDAHRPNDLGLLECFARSTVILGVVDIAQTRIEAIDQIRTRLKAALDHIDRERLIAAPDCGLIMLDRETTAAKLRSMVAAARTV